MCGRNLRGYAQFLKGRGEGGWACRFDMKAVKVKEMDERGKR